MKSIIYILTVALLLAACQSAPGSTEEAAPKEVSTVTLSDEQLKAASITIDSIQQKQLFAELRVNGMVDVPPQILCLSAFPWEVI